MERVLLHRRPAAARFSAACAKGPHISKSSEVFLGGQNAWRKRQKSARFTAGVKGRRSVLGGSEGARSPVSTHTHSCTQTHFTRLSEANVEQCCDAVCSPLHWVMTLCYVESKNSRTRPLFSRLSLDGCSWVSRKQKFRWFDNGSTDGNLFGG